MRVRERERERSLYIYIERESERKKESERERGVQQPCSFLCVRVVPLPKKTSIRRQEREWTFDAPGVNERSPLD